MESIYELVRAFLREGEAAFSRNKNFEAYRDERVQRAVRIFRHLRSVREDLLSVGEGEVRLEGIDDNGDGSVSVRLTWEGAQTRRTSVLSELEWHLLMEDERLTNVLGGLIATLTPLDRERLG